MQRAKIKIHKNKRKKKEEKQTKKRLKRSAVEKHLVFTFFQGLESDFTEQEHRSNEWGCHEGRSPQIIASFDQSNLHSLSFASRSLYN